MNDQGGHPRDREPGAGRSALSESPTNQEFVTPDGEGAVERLEQQLSVSRMKKDKVLRERYHKVSRLNDELSIARDELSFVRKDLRQFESENRRIASLINSIKSSRTWKLLRWGHRVKSRMVPNGSLRQRILRLGTGESVPHRSFIETLANLIDNSSVILAHDMPPPAEGSTSPAVIPDDFYHCELTVLECPTRFETFTFSEALVTIKNISPYTWTTHSRDWRSGVGLSYHWKDQNDKYSVWDGKRTFLASDLDAEESLSTRMEILGPVQPGNYSLEITLVHEGFNWFENKGSPAVSIPLTVERAVEVTEFSFVCSIVIPVFNKAEFTQACLLGIEKTVPGELSYEIIVVDTGSSDGTAELLSAWREKHRNTKIISLGMNSGFARSCNIGASAAQGRYIVLLNNDILPTQGWLEAMLNAADAQCIGAVGSKLLYPNGRIQHVGVAFDENKNPLTIYRGVNLPEATDVTGEFQAVTGACLLVPRKLYRAVGGLDERYTNSYEDIDFCLRIRALGYKVVLCGKAVLYHFESSTDGRKNHDQRNLALFKSRWADKIQSDMDVHRLEGVDEKADAEASPTQFSSRHDVLLDLTKRLYGSADTGKGN